jgi:hypothetical protein
MTKPKLLAALIAAAMLPTPATAHKDRGASQGTPRRVPCEVCAIVTSVLVGWFRVWVHLRGRPGARTVATSTIIRVYAENTAASAVLRRIDPASYFPAAILIAIRGEIFPHMIVSET